MEILLDELIGDLVRIVPMERHHVQDLYESGQKDQRFKLLTRKSR